MQIGFMTSFTESRSTSNVEIMASVRSKARYLLLLLWLLTIDDVTKGESVSITCAWIKLNGERKGTRTYKSN